jgi:thiol:disulfide interchange protein DsbD
LAIGSGVEIGAKITWLVCQEMCLPGKADLTITLPVAAKAQPANRDAFDRWSTQLPERDATQYINSSNVSSSGRHFEFQLTWKRPVSDVDWMPDKNDPITVLNAKVQAQGGATLLSFDVQAIDAPNPPTTIRSLLVFNNDGRRHAVELNIPLPNGWAAAGTSSVSK